MSICYPEHVLWVIALLHFSALNQRGWHEYEQNGHVFQDWSKTVCYFKVQSMHCFINNPE